MKSILAAIALCALAPCANAEIEHVGYLCETQMCFYWWPKVPPIKGWHQETDVSRREGLNALAPDGRTFADADAVMYASAIVKKGSELASADELIAADTKRFLEHAPDSVVTEVEALLTADGKKLRTFTFFPRASGHWEQVSFGEEGEYFIIFTVSGLSKEAYEKALPVFQKMIREYREKPADS